MYTKGKDFNRFSPSAPYKYVLITGFNGEKYLVDGEDSAEAVYTRYTNAMALLGALEMAADTLKEAGKSFAIHNPNAARPNLFEINEKACRAIINRAKGE